MAKPKIIECADCGAPRLTRWKNTKYCMICRLIRNLDFLGDRTEKCLLCNRDFAPLKRGEGLCGECDTVPLFKELVGTCALCDRDSQPLVATNVAICKGCAKDPGKRTLVRKSLLQKRAKIIAGEITIPRPEIPKPKKTTRQETPTI